MSQTMAESSAGDDPYAPAAQERGLAANALVGVVGERIGGKGGGKPDVAQGGGTDVSGIDAAFAAVHDAVRAAVGR